MQSDAALAGKVHSSILGWRSTGSDTADVLYVLVVDGGQSTPWPMIGPAFERGGRWYAGGQYACGVAALVSGGGGCTAPNLGPLIQPVAPVNP